MNDYKIRLSPAHWMFILCLIISIVQIWFDNARFPLDSPLNKHSSMGVMILWMLFMVYIYGVTISQHLSPKVIHCQGNYTWLPHEIAIIKMHRNNAGKQPCPDIRVIPIRGFMALNFYMGGNGRHGWELWWDIPGMGERVGDGLCINSKVRVAYVGRERHQELGFIYDKLKEWVDAKGMVLTDDTTIYVNFVPSDHITVPVGYREALMDFKETNERYGKFIGHQEDLITEQQVSDSTRRAKELGPQWMNKIAPKDVQDNDYERKDQG